MTVRVRGIYATALTRLLTEAGETVVQASPPIRERFDAEFAVAPADATVETTEDRQGLAVSGDPDAVERVADLATGVGRDALRWSAGAPRGAVVDGVVREAGDAGATVPLADGVVGFLPYSKADEHVREGDRLRVQVHEPSPPWADGDPVVGTTLRTHGAVASVERDAERAVLRGPPGMGREEAARTTELLDADVPDGWGVRWGRAAAEADLEAMDAALDRAAARAGDLEAALEGGANGDAPARVVTPEATEWVWFGRESRFAMDGHRAAVETTMAGHHRVKAGSESASAAVDFAEAVAGADALPPADDPDAFPFDAVTAQFGPREGDRVTVGHGKPAGHRIDLGRGEVAERDPTGGVTVRRSMSPGGTYDGLGVERAAGDEAVTRFREGRWWYPTVYRSEGGDRKGTYVNVCTPVEVFPRTVRYVDLHVDVVRHADGRVERLDDDELDAAVERGLVPPDLAEKARSVAASVESALSE